MDSKQTAHPLPRNTGSLIGNDERLPCPCRISEYDLHGSGLYRTLSLKILHHVRFSLLLYSFPYTPTVARFLYELSFHEADNAFYETDKSLVRYIWTIYIACKLATPYMGFRVPCIIYKVNGSTVEISVLSCSSKSCSWLNQKNTETIRDLRITWFYQAAYWNHHACSCIDAMSELSWHRHHHLDSLPHACPL